MSHRDDAAFLIARDDGYLYLPSEPIGWDTTRAGAKAVVQMEGCPTGEVARIVLQVGRVPASLSLSLSLIWNEDRVRGLDLDGPNHTNLRGESIRTPHRQFFLPNGQWETEPVNCAIEGIVDGMTALGYFLNWCGLSSSNIWTDPPPLQPSYLGLPKRAGRRSNAR